jgi:hypothetical protein
MPHESNMKSRSELKAAEKRDLWGVDGEQMSGEKQG